MTWDLAVLLGVLQGLTEFFPVSSSGHLALFGYWFGMREPDLTFDILVHMATLAAIVAYFRKDWLQLGRLLLGKDKGDLPPRILLYLLVSMIPAGLVGLFLKDAVEWIHGRPFWVGVCLLLTATTLLLGLRLSRGATPLAQMGLGVAFAMGLVQAAAVAPGVSRAGVTIMAGLFLGMERRAAARFSFLMAVPIIAGAGLLEAAELWGEAASVSAETWLSYGAGFFGALVSGFFALAFLMRLLDGKRFFYFGFYCIALAVVAMFSALA